MKADLAQTVALQQFGKSILDVARLESVAHLVGEYVVDVLHVVAVPADLAIALLHLTPRQKLLTYRIGHREAAVTGFSFGTVGGNNDGLPVNAGIRDRVVDGDFVLLEVNGLPSESQYLTTP